MFLIEAGNNKIPSEAYLGNELPLLSKNRSVGKWGHVTRNLHICLIFADLMKPRAVVTKLSYSDVLEVELTVYGCISIEKITQNGKRIEINKRKWNEFTNQWSVILKLELSSGTTRMVGFELFCDSYFKKPTKNLYPQSHFVKLRTTNFSLNYKGNRITSYPSTKVAILNIRTELLGNGFIHWNPGNINSLTYSNSIVGISNNKSRTLEQVIHMSHSENRLHVQTLASSTNNKQKEIKVRKFGAMSSEWTKATPRYLARVISGKTSEFTTQHFLNLVGKDIDVYHENLDQILYTQTLVFDSLNEYEEEMNALFIPQSGVNCRSNEENEVFYHVEIMQKKERNLLINLISNAEELFSFKLGGLNGVFELQKSVYFEGRYLNFYQSEITVSSLDDMRLLTRRISIFKNRKTNTFECLLVYRDPNVGRLVKKEEIDETVWVAMEEHNERRRNAAILISFVFFMFSLIYYGIRLRQRSFSEKSEKDLQVIIRNSESSFNC